MLPSSMQMLGIKNPVENTPDELHIAVVTGRTKKIKNLVRKGVHIESVNQLGQTPLFSASYGGDYEVVDTLLRLGANPNRKCGREAGSPVHAAAYRGSRRVLRALIEAGGKLCCKDGNSLLPRDWALKQPSHMRRQKILEFLDLLLAMKFHQMNSAIQFPIGPNSTTSQLIDCPIGSEMPTSDLRLPISQNSMASSQLMSPIGQESMKSSRIRSPIGSDSTSGVVSSGDMTFDPSLNGTLRNYKRRSTGFFIGSQSSLSRRSCYQSSGSIWSSCSGVPSVEESANNKLRLNSYEKYQKVNEGNQVQITPNLHKNVACHLLDQLCVTTSLPLLTPNLLKRQEQHSPAYTCGGPTVYSSYTWLGTPVTVRRPTPALSIYEQRSILNTNSNISTADPSAVDFLLRELSFLRRLRHPGFIEVMAVCHVSHPAPDHVTLVYQHVPLGSLYHHLHVEKKDLTVTGATEILVGILEALLFMHARSTFHCAISSHCVHLISERYAKLGGFEYAIDAQVKGVGMRANHLEKYGWLTPWQAPEAVLDNMVSIQSEVYSFCAVMWELWSGSTPWAGIDDQEIISLMSRGQGVPNLDAAPSLIMYITEHGLKYKSHERDLPFSQIHTMLKSFKNQCRPEERVPPHISVNASSNSSVIGQFDSCCSQSRTSDSSVKHLAICSDTEQNLNARTNSSEVNVRTNTSRKLFENLDSVNKNQKEKYRSLPFGPRPSLSVFKEQESRNRTLDSKKIESELEQPSQPALRPKLRRQRKRNDIEYDSAFIDDEFDSNLLTQPHMQLSIGSRENLDGPSLSNSTVLYGISDSTLSGSESSVEAMYERKKSTSFKESFVSNSENNNNLVVSSKKYCSNDKSFVSNNENIDSSNEKYGNSNKKDFVSNTKCSVSTNLNSNSENFDSNNKKYFVSKTGFVSNSKNTDSIDKIFASSNKNFVSNSRNIFNSRENVSSNKIYGNSTVNLDSNNKNILNCEETGDQKEKIKNNVDNDGNINVDNLLFRKNINESMHVENYSFNEKNPQILIKNSENNLISTENPQKSTNIADNVNSTKNSQNCIKTNENNLISTKNSQKSIKNIEDNLNSTENSSNLKNSSINSAESLLKPPKFPEFSLKLPGNHSDLHEESSDDSFKLDSPIVPKERVKTLTLERSCNNYLPIYSMISDSDE